MNLALRWLCRRQMQFLQSRPRNIFTLTPTMNWQSTCKFPTPSKEHSESAHLGYRPKPKKKGKGKQSTPPTTKPELKKRRISNKSHGESTAYGPPKSTELEPAGHAPTAGQQSMPTETDPAGEAGLPGNAARVKTTRIPLDLHQKMKLPVNVHERFTAGKEGCYIMQSKGNGPEYVFGCSAKNCPGYKRLCQTLAEKLNDGTMHTRQDCKEFAHATRFKWAVAEKPTADA